MGCMTFVCYNTLPNKSGVSSMIVPRSSMAQPVMRRINSLKQHDDGATQVARMLSSQDVTGSVEVLSVDDHPVNQMVVENIVSTMGEHYRVRD